ncbi:MAG TPA: glycoside hydrolase family 76 protein [Terriglobales bacterium]|nr:glycoside hydrolase family 76 protein [Terriglobales bacterium]
MNKIALAAVVVFTSALLACSAAPTSEIFLQLSDKVEAELTKPLASYMPPTTGTTTHHQPFFEDAYGVSALCEAYKLTHNAKYLSTAMSWSEQMIAYQNRMTPRGAYYMNYGRQPGQDHGDWYIADAANIAAAILRTSEFVSPQEHARYLDSVQSFAALVFANYANPDGGISDGIWGTYKSSWWCSTANFGALAFMLYRETGNTEYLIRAQNAFDWLVKHGLANAAYPSFAQDAPVVVFYCGEFYARALPYEMGTPRESVALQQMKFVLRWLAENQKSQKTDSSVDYLAHTHMAGMPHMMYATLSLFPAESSLADAEMAYLYSLVSQNSDPDHGPGWPLLTWFLWSGTGKSGI